MFNFVIGRLTLFHCKDDVLLRREDYYKKAWNVSFIPLLFFSNGYPSLKNDWEMIKFGSILTFWLISFWFSPPGVILIKNWNCVQCFQICQTLKWSILWWKCQLTHILCWKKKSCLVPLKSKIWKTEESPDIDLKLRW